MYVELFVTLKLDPNKAPMAFGAASADLNDWTRSYYSFAYQKRQGDRVFACDFTKDQGRHVHMLPRIKEHVSVDETDPSTFDIDPRLFVELIAKYRLDKNCYPVKRVARK